ncbi:hypothetical protein LguiB_015555 [Lonicera macranthoides]
MEAVANEYTRAMNTKFGTILMLARDKKYERMYIPSLSKDIRKNSFEEVRYQKKLYNDLYLASVMPWLDKAAIIERTSPSLTAEEQEKEGTLCSVAQAKSMGFFPKFSGETNVNDSNQIAIQPKPYYG